ncbi:hypothetical protein F383_08202 [Gossypium arboreum]|uniref:Uncharacterized protein n=1 Tax=Gossypium arboreum TaxID=29729 RepID=A0A0B0PTX6_GOSAR|nr:hypothetical protein F383_08202 [Gossypium arboreum]
MFNCYNECMNDTMVNENDIVNKFDKDETSIAKLARGSKDIGDSVHTINWTFGVKAVIFFGLN